MSEMNNESISTEATAPYEPVANAEETAIEQPKKRWYQKLGQSIGSRIGIFASALLVIALTSGLSAYAGASAVSKDSGLKNAPIERTLDGHDAQGQRDDNSRRADNQRDRGTDELQKSQKSDTTDDQNNGVSSSQDGKDANDRGADSSNAKKNAGASDTAA